MTAVAACRTCGTEPLENARFCHGCGSPVDEVDTFAKNGTESRHPSTVVFVGVQVSPGDLWVLGS
jgi:hypothetical protein